MNKDILSQIRSNTSEREKAIRSLVSDESLTSKIRRYVIQNNGTHTDYETVLSDTMMILIKQTCNNPGFTLSSTLEAYLMGIAKYVWLGYLRKNKTEPTHNNQLIDGNTSDHIPSGEEIIMHTERGEILDGLLTKMGPTCKDILKYWSMKYRMDEIAKFVGIESEGYLRKKKHECMKALKQLVSSNPSLKEQLL